MATAAPPTNPNPRSLFFPGATGLPVRLLMAHIMGKAVNDRAVPSTLDAATLRAVAIWQAENFLIEFGDNAEFDEAFWWVLPAQLKADILAAVGDQPPAPAPEPFRLNHNRAPYQRHYDELPEGDDDASAVLIAN